MSEQNKHVKDLEKKKLKICFKNCKIYKKKIIIGTCFTNIITFITNLIQHICIFVYVCVCVLQKKKNECR